MWWAHGTSFDCIIRECRLVGERWAGSNSELGEKQNAPPGFDRQCALNQLITQLWLNIKLFFFFFFFLSRIYLKEKPDMRWFSNLPPSSTTASWETLVKSNICIFYFPCGVTFSSHHPALHVCRRSCCCTRSHSGGGSQGCLRFCTLARFFFFFKEGCPAGSAEHFGDDTDQRREATNFSVDQDTSSCVRCAFKF